MARKSATARNKRRRQYAKHPAILGIARGRPGVIR